jgi:hypothetical protein
MDCRVYEKARACLCVLLPALLLLNTQARADDGDTSSTPIRLGNYELGRGLPLGESGFTVGGYATARYDDVRGRDPRVTADHLSLMLWWEGGGRLKFFSETDFEESLATRRTGPDEERFLALERFYFDYTVNDSATVRIGKFLTPIGRWNPIHADPLVWTTSRPMVTHAVFPGYATGVMLQGTTEIGEREMDYSVYVSSGTELRRKPAEDPFTEARGVHFNLPVSSKLQVGLSLADFEQDQTRGERKRLAGMDFLWSHKRWEISGEGIYRGSSAGAPHTEKGGFVQVVAPLRGRLYAIGRYEQMHLDGTDHPARNWVAGLNYRYDRALSLKAEVTGGSHLPDGTPEGLLASISVLF